MKNILPVLLCTFLSGSFSFAQTTIKGKITDSQNDQPLAGATVGVGGTSARTTTNNKGEFELKSDNPIKEITISFIGYETQKIKTTSTDKSLKVAMVSNNLSLKEVTVTGYGNNRKLLETAGSVATLTSKEMQRGDNMDILPAMNTIPGVKMEAYTASNYRIAIRGSLINNPWGIRNVKIYWDDIPLSSPDGTAQKSIDFDPTLIGSLEVLKGPSGSMYGAGNGGVILIKSAKASFGQNSLEAGYTGGSYGFGRFHTSYKTSGENFSITANVVSQRYAGYRENNWGNKDAINLFAQIFPGEKRKLNFFMTHVTGSIGIAGGLNKFQADSMPTQALQFCKDNKISVKKYNATVFGASQTYHFTDLFSNTSSVYGNFQTYDHPYGSSIYYNGFFKESMGGYGGRTKFVYAPSLGKVKSRFSLGGEYQYQHQHGNTFKIVQDVAGTWPETGGLFQNDIIISKSAIVFAQAELDLPAKFFLTLGASYNKLSYDIQDFLADSGHINYSGITNFPEKISPRIGLVKLLGTDLAAHGSMSYGYSPPPVWELNNYDGTLNTDLKPEDGVNYEFGLRGTVLKGKLNFDVSFYQMFLSNAIVPVANEYGATSYRNSGLTDQKGIEAMLSYVIINDKAKIVSLVKPWINYAYNHYTFKDYKAEFFDWNNNEVKEIDYSGKKVTGTCPNTISAGVDLESKAGVYFNTVFYWYDKTPLNDANTYYTDAYSLLNLKLGFRKPIKQFAFDLFAGINNATNTHYSSLLLYNADATSFGAPPQFYNPSPGVNYYGGMKLTYNFK